MLSQRTTPGILPWLAVLLACVAVATEPARAQEPFVNYDELSFLDEPLATEIGDVSLVLRGQVEGMYAYRSQEGGETDESLDGGFQVGAQTQLPNRWRVQLAYSGRYATDPEDNPDSGFASRTDDDYEDTVALSVGSAWGTVAGGNVSETVRDQTRRARGAGAASLAFDDVFGSVGEWGGGYVVRFGPTVLGTVVDKDGDFDVGAMYQRPSGDKDYRLSARYTEGAFTSADGTRRFDTRAFSGVGEFIYASILFDVGAGYETLSSPGLALHHWFVSSGVRIKKGVVSFSLEGHHGRVEGEQRTSCALGLQYDMARGFSVNFGLNHEDAKVNLKGVNLIDSKGTTAVLSLRFSF